MLNSYFVCFHQEKLLFSKAVFLCLRPLYLLGQVFCSQFQTSFHIFLYPESLLFSQVYSTAFFFSFSFPCMLMTNCISSPPTLLSNCLNVLVKAHLSGYKCYVFFSLWHWWFLLWHLLDTWELNCLLRRWECCKCCKCCKCCGIVLALPNSCISSRALVLGVKCSGMKTSWRVQYSYFSSSLPSLGLWIQYRISVASSFQGFFWASIKPASFLESNQI